MKKRRITYLRGRVHTDELGRMYKKVGNAHIYLNDEAMKEIEARKVKK